MKKRFILCAFLIFGALITAVGQISAPAAEKREKAVVRTAKKQKKITVTLSFAGDCTLGSDLKYGKGNSFIEVYENEGAEWFFSNVKSIFEDDDLTIVNLEGPLTNEGTKADKQFAFRGPPEFTGILTAGSVEVVNLANNHSRDYGEKGYQDTQKNLDAAGIASYGLGKPYIPEVNGVRIGFLGYTAWGADNSAKNKITEDIKKMRDAGASAVVCTFHGGTEATSVLNAAQKTLYRHAIDAGADLVVGHHPHVLQAIEQYKGKFIAYSLGNFSFGGNRNPTDKDTVIFRQIFEFDPATKAKTGGRAEIVPCRVSSVTNRNDFKPTPLSGDEGKRIINKIDGYSKALNGDKSLTELLGIYETAGE